MIYVGISASRSYVLAALRALHRDRDALRM
jgi:hypothetical protein